MVKFCLPEVLIINRLNKLLLKTDLVISEIECENNKVLHIHCFSESKMKFIHIHFRNDNIAINSNKKNCIKRYRLDLNKNELI